MTPSFLNKAKGQLYRLFIIGKKSFPEIRKSEARASERYWARVDGNITSTLRSGY
jgi:hypothetical protein